MPSAKPGRRSQSPFPAHYESTRIEGKQHPADAVIDRLPAVVRARRRLLRMFEELQPATNDQKSLRAYADACGQYQTLRENLFYGAGFEHGLIHARQDNLAERMANDPVARKLMAEINQLILSTELPRDRLVMLLLETAWALVFGIVLPGGEPGKVSPELLAIREVLWPDGDMDHQWSPDTLDQIARIARPREQVGKKGKHHG